MTTRLRRQTRIMVPRVAGEPIYPFTPEGERLWATDGWDPHYADPARNDGVGAVFTTDHGDRRKVWVIVDRTGTSIRYAGMTPGEAGTLEVAVEGEPAPVGTPVSVFVAYDLTALSADGAQSLALFDDHFEDEIGSWERDIQAAISAGAFDRGGPPRTDTF